MRQANLAYVLWVTAYNTSFVLAYVCIFMLILEPAAKAERHLNASTTASTDEVKSGSFEGDGRASDKFRVDERNYEKNDTTDEGRSMTPALLRSLNTHAFAVFLIVSEISSLALAFAFLLFSPSLTFRACLLVKANLLTGTINLTMQTMYATNAVAVFLLLLYTGTCLASASFLDVLDWKLRI